MSILKSLNFGGNEVLQRNQMKSVLGGDSIMHAPGPGDHCEAVETVPTGCPCHSSLPCAGGSTMIWDSYLERYVGSYRGGACVNGYCGH
tara:strand:+ start:2161 stop:2427 length:267 start_codon:yes stop_codon:yes gene_type:complete